jgi:peptidylprolyl isomerase
MSLEKPEIDFPDFPVPADLLIEDITVGTGEEAKAGQQVTVHYAGVSYSTGEEFDASWNRGEVFSFPLGRGRVIRAGTRASPA